MQREKTPEWWGKTERLTWHKARTGVSLSFSISYTSSVAWASDADYDVRLVQDCCYDPDRDAHEALLRSGFGGRVQVV